VSYARHGATRIRGAARAWEMNRAVSRFAAAPFGFRRAGLPWHADLVQVTGLDDALTLYL
jgi:hypothetical protein